MPPKPPKDHLRRAIAFVRAATAALSGDIPEAVAHGAYYACLHTALALLSTVGIVADTYKGIASMMSLHFIKDGPLPRPFGRLYGHLMSDRELSDYEVGDNIDAAAAREMARKAVEFLTAAIPVVMGSDPAVAPEAERLLATVRQLDAAAA